MKRKIFSILFALVLVVSFSLVAAVPAAAEEGGIHETWDYWLPLGEDCGFDHMQMKAETPCAFKAPIAFEIMLGGEGGPEWDWTYDDSWSQTYNDGTLLVIDGNRVEAGATLYFYIHFSGSAGVNFHYQAWDEGKLVCNQDIVKEEGGWWNTPAGMGNIFDGTWEALRLSPAEVKVDAPAEVAPGVSFTATVDPDLVDFDACNYDVVFNHTVLSLDAVTYGQLDSTTIPVIHWNKIEDGRYRVVQNVPGTDGVTGSGYLAKLWFTVIGSDGQSSEIALENGCLSDKNAQEILATWAPATVDIVILEAGFDVDATEGYVNDTSFQFTDTTTGGTTPYTYLWNFGDGGTGTGATPTHTYATAGTYTVSLTVKDTWKGTDIETKTGLITVYNTLKADFSGTPTEGIKGSTLHPATVQFTDGSTGGKPSYTYDWTFGDGGMSTDANPIHSYAPAGTKTGLEYTVSLTVDDSLTASDDEVKADYITIYQMGDINADLTVDSADITKIERLVAAKDTLTFTADANEDGNINALDITKTELLVTAAHD